MSNFFMIIMSLSPNFIVLLAPFTFRLPCKSEKLWTHSGASLKRKWFTNAICASMLFLPVNTSWRVESLAVTVKSTSSGSETLLLVIFQFIFWSISSQPCPLSVTVPLPPCFASKTQVALPQSSPITLSMSTALSSLTISLEICLLPSSIKFAAL